MTSSPELHSEIAFDEPCVVPLNEIVAAMTVLARLDRVLQDEGNPVAERLIGLGSPLGSDRLLGNDIPAGVLDHLPEGPEVVNETTAREYVRALKEHLRSRKPNGAFDKGNE